MDNENKIEVLDEDETAALNAQIKHNKAIAANSVEILHRINRLEKLGGEQDYTYIIMEAFKAFGSVINLSFLSPVCGDQALFTKARKKLIEKGLIVELAEKNRKVLKLVNAA